MEFSLRANQSLFLGDLRISALVGADSHLDPRVLGKLVWAFSVGVVPTGVSLL